MSADSRCNDRPKTCDAKFAARKPGKTKKRT